MTLTVRSETSNKHYFVELDETNQATAVGVSTASIAQVGQVDASTCKKSPRRSPALSPSPN